MAQADQDDQEDDLSTSKMKKQVENFLMQTIDARITSEKCRDYYDSKQWTADEVAKLAARQQAPIVVNRVKPKVDGLKGLVAIRMSDPKAYPRTKKHEKASYAITDGLRYVSDANDFTETKLACAEDFFVEGYTGAFIDTEKSPNGDINICIHQIPWDRIYFDPHSRKKDFSDARYMGIIMWMDEEELEEKFPDVDFESLQVSPEDQTFADRPRWSDRLSKRRRIAHHFYKEQGQWYMCIFSGDNFLVEPAPSPYEDEFGQPSNPIELISAYVDRDNARYGEVLSFLDQQDEINHRRSKALHLLSQRQTAARSGTIKDIATMKRELAKPDGHVEWVGEKADFQILQTSDMARGQFELYQDAKNELDAVSYNAQLAGERAGQGDLSGVAINKLQQAGTVELNGLFILLNGWEKRIYRQIWFRIKQFWTAEKWIRVTDDQDTLRWVGLNAQVTAQQWLEDLINDASTPLQKRKQAAAAYQHLMATQDPALENIVDIKNKPAELDVDIILEQSFDTINVQQEQFQLLMQFAQNSPDIDICELIQLSQLRGKDELIAKIEERRKAQAEAAGQTADVAKQAASVKMREVNAKASKHEQDAIKTHIENSMLVNGQTQITSVSA